LKTLSADSRYSIRDPELEAQFRLAQAVIGEQSLAGAVIAGLVGAIAGAFAWGAVALGTGAIIAVVAIGVGALVGFGVRVFGRGVTDVYAIVATSMAILGCAAGNLLALILFELAALDLSISQAVALLDPKRLLDDFVGTLGIMELFYWLVAAYSAWWLAKRGLSKEEAAALDAYWRYGPPAVEND
jgi:hypothetical protein